MLSKSQTTEMWVEICPEGLWIFSGVSKLKLQLCLRLGLFFLRYVRIRFIPLFMVKPNGKKFPVFVTVPSKLDLITKTF